MNTLFDVQVQEDDIQSGFLDVRAGDVYIRTKPTNQEVLRETRDIGFYRVRIGNRLYECWGYERKHLKSKKTPTIDKSIIVLKQIKSLKDGEWVEVDAIPITTTLPIAVYKSLTAYEEYEAR